MIRCTQGNRYFYRSNCFNNPLPRHRKREIVGDEREPNGGKEMIADILKKREREGSWFSLTEEEWNILLSEITRLQTALEEKERELVEIKSRTWCAYCGHEIPIDDEASSKISEHIMSCSNHPIRIYERHAEALEEQNTALKQKCDTLFVENVGLKEERRQLTQRVKELEKKVS